MPTISYNFKDKNDKIENLERERNKGIKMRKLKIPAGKTEARREVLAAANKAIFGSLQADKTLNRFCEIFV